MYYKVKIFCNHFNNFKLQLLPEDSEDYIDYLISIDRLDEACQKLADLVNDESFISKVFFIFSNFMLEPLMFIYFNLKKTKIKLIFLLIL